MNICVDPTDLNLFFANNWTEVQPYQMNRTYGSSEFFFKFKVDAYGVAPNGTWIRNFDMLK